jgi:hypothetical protein
METKETKQFFEFREMYELCKQAKRDKNYRLVIDLCFKLLTYEGRIGEHIHIAKKAIYKNMANASVKLSGDDTVLNFFVSTQRQIERLAIGADLYQRQEYIEQLELVDTAIDKLRAIKRKGE